MIKAENLCTKGGVKMKSVFHAMFYKFFARRLHMPLSFMAGMIFANAFLNEGSRLHIYLPISIGVLVVVVAVNIFINMMARRKERR